MDDDVKRCLMWVQWYKESGNAGVTCRRCGLSRSTLRKWVRRFDEHGLSGLETRSSCPLSSPKQKVDDGYRSKILELRETKNWRSSDSNRDGPGAERMAV